MTGALRFRLGKAAQSEQVLYHQECNNATFMSVSVLPSSASAILLEVQVAHDTLQHGLLIDDDWHHIAVSFRSGSGLFFVDGVLRNSWNYNYSARSCHSISVGDSICFPCTLR
eukprot:TRINITY_DN4272_c0_g1_i1.p1 TRINITY_DN4272_c0_g1~~TRINITY_DN4272_c0_g1_i1.p1  ORF type:complete len:113 (+),score=4.87 TRINITY_DN4272_c0_g1_i1:161-499(+)